MVYYTHSDDIICVCISVYVCVCAGVLSKLNWPWHAVAKDNFWVPPNHCKCERASSSNLMTYLGAHISNISYGLAQSLKSFSKLFLVEKFNKPESKP